MCDIPDNTGQNDLDGEARAIYDLAVRALGNLEEGDREDIKEILRIAEGVMRGKKRLKKLEGDKNEM